MTRADAAELWELLDRIDGPRSNCDPERLTDEQWREGCVDFWWDMARCCCWERGPVLDAVETLATWAGDWQGRTDRPPVVTPADINYLLGTRRAIVGMEAS